MKYFKLISPLVETSGNITFFLKIPQSSDGKYTKQIYIFKAFVNNEEIKLLTTKKGFSRSRTILGYYFPCRGRLESPEQLIHKSRVSIIGNCTSSYRSFPEHYGWNHEEIILKELTRTEFNKEIVLYLL